MAPATRGAARRAAPGPASSPEEQKQLPDVLAAFKEYLKGHLQTRFSVSTYFTSMSWICRNFERSFDYMATSSDELVDHIRESADNYRRARICSATLKMFGRFWAERHAKGRKRKAARLEAGKEASTGGEGPKRKTRAAATTAKARRRKSKASSATPGRAAQRARRKRERRAEARAAKMVAAAAGPSSQAPAPSGSAAEASALRPSAATLFGMWPRRPSAAGSGGSSAEAPAASATEDAAAALTTVPGRRATPAEEEEFPALLERFFQHLKHHFKAVTAEAYKSGFLVLWSEFHRAPTVMANSVSFLRFVVQWPKNKRGNSQYSSALKAFRIFWAANQQADLKAQLLSSAPAAAAAATDGAPGRLATAPEEEEVPALLERFGGYLGRQHKPTTAKCYKANFTALWTEFHRAPSVMANSVAFLRFVEQMPKNKRTNSQISASLKAFRAFWASEKGGLKGALSSIPRPSPFETSSPSAAAAPELAEARKDVLCVDLLDVPADQEPRAEPSSRPAPAPAKPQQAICTKPSGNAAVWDVMSDVEEEGEEERQAASQAQEPGAKAEEAAEGGAVAEDEERQAASETQEPGARAEEAAEGGEVAEDEAWAVALNLLSELEGEPSLPEAAASGAGQAAAEPAEGPEPEGPEAWAVALNLLSELEGEPSLPEAAASAGAGQAAVEPAEGPAHEGRQVEQGPTPAELRADGPGDGGEAEEAEQGPAPGEQQADGLSGCESEGRNPDSKAEQGPAPGEQQADGLSGCESEGRNPDSKEPEPGTQEEVTAEASQPTEQSAAGPMLGGQQADCPCEGVEVEANHSQEDDAVCSSQPASSSAQGAGATAKRHSYGLKALKVDEWIREAARRYKVRPPERQEALYERTERRQEHIDATLLDVLRQRAVKAGLGAFLRCKLRRPKWGDAELEAWVALARKEAEEQPQNLDPAEDPGEEEDEDEAAGGEAGRRAKAEEDEPSSKAWAAAHTVRRLGERWPSKRPCQRWQELKQGRKTGEACEEAREEHECAVTLKVMRYQFLEGALPEATFHELLRLPESWALDMVLTWQAHLMIKLSQISDAFPQGMPSQAQLDEDSEPARWVREYRRQACSRCGLSPHLSAELKAWLPWGAEALSQWLPQQWPESAVRCKRGLCNERQQPLERLRQMVIKFPTAPPTKRVYVSSEEERDEQTFSNYLERVCKWHLVGIVTSEAVLAVVGHTPWVSELLVEWERNKSEGIDPEENATIQRLQDIGERHPLMPPTQAAALERERWSWPEELRFRHADAWFLRCLKDKFFAHGVSEAVEKAMRAIPVWGAPRLEEWRVQKDQRAHQIFERQHRTWKKKTELGQGGDGAEEGEEGEGEASHSSPHFKRRTPPPTLRDSDRLHRTGKEPRCHVSRVRVDRCHGKTVGEALASVRTGVLRLTRKIIAQDIQGGHLRLERAEGAEDGGIAGALGATVGPSTPSRAPSAARPPASSQKRPREEHYRSLTGKVVRVERPTNRPNKPKELTELKDLTPGEIDQLLTEDLYHYERQLGWTSKRALAERLEKLSKELQANTLPWAAPSTPAAAEEGPDSWPANFAELTAYQRMQLRGRELQHFEQQGLIADGKDLSLQERRERLKDYIWKTGEGGAAAAKKEQVFMKQWQATATTRTGVTTIEDDDDE